METSTPRDWRSAIAALALSLSMAAAAVPATRAQDETPVVPEEATTPYPATMHRGTCTDFDPRPAFILEAAVPRAGELQGSPAAAPVVSTTATLDVPFGDLLANQPYAVLIHPSPDEFGSPVACGDVGGIVSDDALVMALRPVEASGLAGLAILTEQAGLLQLGDELTDIAIHVFAIEDPEVPGIGTPEPVATAGEGFAHPEWLVDPAWLEQNLDQPNVHVLGVQGLDTAAQGGVPGAWQVAPEFWLPADTSEETLQLWREQVAIQLGSVQMGIPDGAWSPGDTIVLYDSGTMDAAALWWVLDYFGHDDKRMLNGGWQAWADYWGVPETGMPAAPLAPAGGVTNQFTPYQGAFREEVLSTLDEVAASIEDEQVVLVDSRSPEAYAAGHIPGAVNVPATDNLVAGSQYWRDAATLQEHYAAAGVDPGRRVITYGETGPGAAMTYVTLRLLGHEDVSLYPGGWDEWNRYPDLPRATAESAEEGA
ncbi:MAG: hypothetical protein KY456_04150 [Chloroflexi bacterium]|nr:hypothetical protein [Chloroflexota bacterium]